MASNIKPNQYIISVRWPMPISKVKIITNKKEEKNNADQIALTFWSGRISSDIGNGVDIHWL